MNFLRKWNNFGKSSNRNRITLMNATLLVLGAFLILYPIVMVILASFKSQLEMFSSPFSLPESFQFRNYAEAWERINFPTALKNSLIMTVVPVICIVVFGSLAGYACARSKTKLVRFIYNLFVGCIIIPFYTAMIPLANYMGKLHWNNTYFGVSIVYIGINISLAVFIYTGFIRALPVEIEEAARVDGCSRFQTFLRIIFPMSAPTTATVIILSSLSIWNDFLIPLILLSRKEMKNLPISLFTFQGQYNTEWNLTFAALVLAAIPIVIIYIVLQKYIIKGVASGSLKG
jgi:raffinose/stachyose/melibiose transport system permease protein